MSSEQQQDNNNSYQIRRYEPQQTQPQPQQQQQQDAHFYKQDQTTTTKHRDTYYTNEQQRQLPDSLGRFAAADDSASYIDFGQYLAAQPPQQADNSFQPPQQRDYNDTTQITRTTKTTTTTTTSAQDDLTTRQRKPGTKLVKRWNWNQERFVETEVPDEPRAAPPRVSPASMANSGPFYSRPRDTEQWHVHADAERARRPQQREQVVAGPMLGVSEIVARDEAQPWLVARVPDEQSVNKDPLYKDLMLELRRLEEGIEESSRATSAASSSMMQQQQQQRTSSQQQQIVRQQQLSLTPETSQKPVFGQQVTPAAVELSEYEGVEFVCRLIPISDPTMRVEWLRDGRPLQESSRVEHEHEFGVVRLCIKRVEPEDAGTYECRATNALGVSSSYATLRVRAKPTIQFETLHPQGLDKITRLENPTPVAPEPAPRGPEQAPKFVTHIVDYVEKNEGDSVHYECCLAPVDDPDLKTEWFFNGRPLVTGSRFHTIDDFGFIVLDIDWLYPRDTGEYVCRATNKYGSDMTRTVLRVKPGKSIELESQLDNPNVTIDKLRQLEFPDVEQPLEEIEPDKPARFVQPLRSRANKSQFVEGENVHFEARAGPASDGALTVEWFHNDKPLISGHRFKPAFDFGHIKLDILYVYAEDSGVYRCVARNATGEDSTEFEINVAGKPSLVYQTQLPQEMVGGVQKITDMEAMWNRAPDPEEEAPPAERSRPEFKLKPKNFTAFEGNVARFCCHITGNPRPRVVWTLNGQQVVTGSRSKLTYDGMHHLTLNKCALSDAGRLEVHARNPLGECYAAAELFVKRKVDDYRGVLKNSPRPWYDEQSLKVYQRTRANGDDDYDTLDAAPEYAESLASNGGAGQTTSAVRLNFATPHSTVSPGSAGFELVNYMEPGTPDVNLLARLQSPLAGDLHPVVVEQQSVMAPAPSTIQRALAVKDTIPKMEGRSYQLPSEQQHQQHRDVYGVAARPGSPGAASLASSQTDSLQRRHLQQQQQHRLRPDSAGSQAFDPRLPPASPESMVHGREVHSHTHKQTQLERRANKEIMREIIEREIFEQEHRGVTKENLVRGGSVERRSSTPQRDYASSTSGSLPRHSHQQQFHNQEQQQQQQQLYGAASSSSTTSSLAATTTTMSAAQQADLIALDNMIPPEFTLKIQPCQAVDGDEAQFECEFHGDPTPTITWYRDNKLIKPSNLYVINTSADSTHARSTLIIKRVTLQSNAVYTVKAENAAGSAKSSANLLVEPHPMREAGARGGIARQLDPSVIASAAAETSNEAASSTTVVTTTTTTTSNSNADAAADASVASSMSESLQLPGHSKVVKSVRTRKLSADEMATLIRASPEGLVAPAFLHTIHDTHTRPGELARLDARLIGSPPIDIRWLKDGQRVRADRTHKMVLEGDLYTLLIIECSPQDEGVYECVATNCIGEARCAARLSVNENAGRLSSMSSRATPDPTAPPLSAFSSQQQQQSTTTTTTVVTSSSSQAEQSAAAAAGENAQRQHFGVTKHQPHQLVSHYTPQPQEGQPQPQVQQPKLIKGLDSQQVREGKSVTLRCQISSFPVAEVHWYKTTAHGDKLIKPSKYFRLYKDNDETYCMRILETFAEDQGEYKCVARASNAYVETCATINVIPNSPN